LYSASTPKKTAPNALYTLVLGEKKCLANTEVAWTGSRNCFGREFHVVGPATREGPTFVGTLQAATLPLEHTS